MHEDDGGGLEALRARGPQRVARGGKIGRAFDRAIGADALVDLDDAGVELLRLDDIARENVGPGLIADLQRVGEAVRRHQQRARALALQQRVGGDGRAHLDAVDEAGRDRRAGGYA